MPVFKDSLNREWEVKMNYPVIERVKGMVQVEGQPLDLFTLADGKHVELIVGDTAFLCRLVWAMIKPQAEAKGIGEEAFMEGIAGEAFDRLSDAIVKAALDFFPPGRAEVLKTLVSKTRQAMKMAEAKAIQVVNDPKLMAKALERMEAELARRGFSSGNAPESSASTPAS